MSLFIKWLKKFKINNDQYAIGEELKSSKVVQKPAQAKINKKKDGSSKVSKNRNPYAFIAKNFKNKTEITCKKKIDFPHTKKILNFANLSKKRKH